jgi:two-component system, chemotaxis family, response regulator Rcp1
MLNHPKAGNRLNGFGAEQVLRKPAHVLLVDDNPGDVRLMQEALRECRLDLCLTVAGDGEEALQILKHRAPNAPARKPDLILLDLNLPGRNGKEVLLEIKTDPELQHIPVIVMTTSRAEQDVRRVYNLNANCYITKPLDLDEFLHVVRSIENFWFRVATLPYQ